MQTFTILALVSFVAAAPAGTVKAASGPVPCTGTLYAQQACCATDVLGIVSLDCYAPPMQASNGTQLVQECAARGQQAECCSIPLLGQALLCELVPDM